MRVLVGLGLALSLAAAGFGQHRPGAAGSGFGNVVFPGTGRTTMPSPQTGFGNVVFPGRAHAPGFTPSFASRLGGNVSGFAPYTGARPGFHGRTPVAVPYAYPVFMGGYYDAYPQQQQPNVTVVYPPQQTPITIINQYPSEQMQAAAPESPEASAAPSSETTRFYQAPAPEPAPAAAATAEPAYYLIAFKDHSIYSAVAYWVEGDTLHYFTRGNVHNQASLSLVDSSLTEQLNRDRDVRVRLPR